MPLRAVISRILSTGRTSWPDTRAEAADQGQQSWLRLERSARCLAQDSRGSRRDRSRARSSGNGRNRDGGRLKRSLLGRREEIDARRQHTLDGIGDLDLADPFRGPPARTRPHDEALVDELPEVPGLRERWGRDVLHCPYCHGWEVRDQAIGVLASGPLAVHPKRRGAADPVAPTGQASDGTAAFDSIRRSEGARLMAYV